MFHTFVQPKQGKRHLIWVDDRFFAKIENWDKNKFGADEHAPPMGDKWVRAVSENAPNMFEGETIRQYVNYGIGFLKVCDKLGFGFTVTNFDHLNSNPGMLQNPQCHLLVDMRNIMVRNEAHSTEMDGNWPSNLYGAYFVKHWGIPADRYRFFTRYSWENGIVKDVAVLFSFDSGRDCLNSLFIETAPGTERAASDVEDWLSSGMLHNIAEVNRALHFYSTPWRENWEVKRDHVCHWSHIVLGSNDKRYKGIWKEWLEADFDSGSAKALCIWNTREKLEHQASQAMEYPWELQNAAFYINRKIKEDMLRQVFRVLGLNCVKIIDTRDKKGYPPPISPGLPFFLSLRCFYEALKEHGRPFEEMVMDRFEGNTGELYSLTIPLIQEQDTNAGAEMAKAFHDVLSQNGLNPGRFHGTARALRDLLFCRCQVKMNNGMNEWTRAFIGKGLSSPCAGILFRPDSIRLVWTGWPGEN